jgi:hypothetical protein
LSDTDNATEQGDIPENKERTSFAFEKQLNELLITN